MNISNTGLLNKDKNSLGEKHMFNRFIKDSSDLVTSHDEIRAGFLSIALEKNRISDPYVKKAFAFKTAVKNISEPEELIKISKIRPFLIAASGLSEKSMQYLDDNDQTKAIKELIDKFLKPAGDNFIDEVIYRYLLIKGDTVGGIMRNRVGALGEEKLIRALLSNMGVQGITYEYTEGAKNQHLWLPQPINDTDIEKVIKALYWRNDNGPRILCFDTTIPLVGKNVDICLFEGDKAEYDKLNIRKHPEKGLMFGELKGGIDPAGADEHWKTGNTALGRIRQSFESKGYTVLTSFIGAAIANAMAVEIYGQLKDGILSNAANLTNTDQLNEYCAWILDI